jgi:DNA-binding NtrC family response regulator
VRLVVIDDDRQHLQMVRAALADQGLEIHAADDPRRGLELVKRLRPQIILLDLVMPGVHGMEIDPGTDVILMTGYYSTESAVEAIQKGACDYLSKPLRIEKLRQRVAQLVEEAKRRLRGMELEGDLADAFEFEGMIGRSPLMLELFAMIRRIAPHFRTVLVTGPTGAGKDLVAKALHKQSPAQKGPFVAVNCSSITETLAESELFGYVKGAFTGALQDKVGVFEFASGGTVLLEEIGDMPLPLQAKLLPCARKSRDSARGLPDYASRERACGGGYEPKPASADPRRQVSRGSLLSLVHGRAVCAVLSRASRRSTLARTLLHTCVCTTIWKAVRRPHAASASVAGAPQLARKRARA